MTSNRKNALPRALEGPFRSVNFDRALRRNACEWVKTEHRPLIPITRAPLFHRDIIRIDHFGDGPFSLPRRRPSLTERTRNPPTVCRNSNAHPGRGPVPAVRKKDLVTRSAIGKKTPGKKTPRARPGVQSTPDEDWNTLEQTSDMVRAVVWCANAKACACDGDIVDADHAPWRGGAWDGPHTGTHAHTPIAETVR